VDEDRANALFARYVERLVVDGVRLSATDLASGDPELMAELQRRVEAFGRIEEILGRATEPLTGQTLGHYRVHESLGAGGMGEVYRAFDTRLGREVALKVLPPLFALDPARRARFEREARLLASLDHPNIEAIYGIESAGDRLFLVLELVEGETLAERMTRGPLPLEEACPLFIEIANALEASHATGIIHRDLKPANVKLTRDGRAKLLDFGLGKALGERELSVLSLPLELSRDTATGVILGTASYMSPEQARGREVDKRTDIWSFGCVLFEALTGRVAYQGDSFADTLAAVLHRDPEWEALPKTTPLTLRALLRRALEKDPERRPDVGEARRMLQEVLERPRARTPTAARVGAALVAGLLVALLAATLLANRTPRGARPSTLASVTPLELPTPAAKLMVDREAYRTTLKANYASWRAAFDRGPTSGSAGSFVVCVTTREPPALDMIDPRTSSVAAHIPLPAKETRDRIIGVAMSPDGDRAYVAGLDADRVFVVDLKSQFVLAVPDGSGIAVGDRPFQVALTPDGRRAYVTLLSGAVSVIDTDPRSPRFHTVVRVPDGRAIRVGTEPTGIAIAPDATRAFVTDMLADAVFVLDIAHEPAFPHRRRHA